ncbi:MAG: EAL domain-containing protein [Clostridiales bacterium]|nr:EAL domain-containing protein [Clostridiales bacterium]
MDCSSHPLPTVAQLCDVIELLYPCMDDYLYVYDLKNDFYFISPNALDRFLMPSNQFHDVEKTHEQFVYPADLPLLQEDLADIVNGKKSGHNLHYRWVGHDKQPLWINCRGRVVKDENGLPSYMIGCINETGAKQRADNVSGLLGEASLRTLMQSITNRNPAGFIMRLGIDDFKDINENLGIEYGDQILKRTADCIASCIQPGQQLFRIVADEFIILDLLGGTTEDAVHLYKHIRQAIDLFIKENHYEAVYTISAGILSNRFLADSSYANVMKLSEFSLNEAKRNGKNRCYVFLPENYDAFLRRKKLLHTLRHAVHHNFDGFEVYFQPITYASSRQLRGAEALLRFHNEETGPVSPFEFIPLLEETGLIIPVGRFVLNQALAACQKWRGIVPGFSVSINLSYIQVMKSHILNEIIEGVQEYLLSPSSIIIELTESGYLESNPHFTKLWSKLKEYGIALALDDFGTGYSNLHYLHDLNPNIIKIDRSFTLKALRNDYEYNLLIHIIEMVHSLGLLVCIEGIETQEELNKINQLKPDYIQGYFFGKPCSYADFEAAFIEIN